TPTEVVASRACRRRTRACVDARRLVAASAEATSTGTVGQDGAMKLGLFSINMGSRSGPEALAAAASAAEAAGFDSVWAGEHVVLLDPQVPPSPMAPQDPAFDPLLALAWAAAH